MTWTGPEDRLQRTRCYGAETMDLLHIHFRCEGCDWQLPDPVERSIVDPAYRTAQAFEALAVRLAAGLAGVEAVCDGCSASSPALAFDLHGYHGGEQRDLIVRVRPVRRSSLARAWARLTGRSGPVVERYWWDGVVYEPAADLTGAQADRFRRDASVRAAEAVASTEGIEAAAPLIEELVEHHPGDLALVAHAEALVRAGRTNLAGRVIDASLAARPRSDGYYVRALRVVRLVRDGRLPHERLADALTDLRRATDRDPEYEAAWILRAQILGAVDPDAGLRAFEDLLRLLPNGAPLHRAVAAALRDRDPDRASGHLAEAARSRHAAR